MEHYQKFKTSQILCFYWVHFLFTLLAKEILISLDFIVHHFGKKKIFCLQEMDRINEEYDGTTKTKICWC